jgi:hypothetical protein
MAADVRAFRDAAEGLLGTSAVFVSLLSLLSSRAT